MSQTSSACIFPEEVHIFSVRNKSKYLVIFPKMFHSFTAALLMKYSMSPYNKPNDFKLQTVPPNIVKTWGEQELFPALGREEGRKEISF